MTKKWADIPDTEAEVVGEIEELSGRLNALQEQAQKLQQEALGLQQRGAFLNGRLAGFGKMIDQQGEIVAIPKKIPAAKVAPTKRTRN